MTIDETLRSAKVIDKDGYGYVIHPLTDGVPRTPPALLREWVAWAAAQPMVHEANLLLAPEAMALPLATALSLETDLPVVVARKREYGLDGETIAYCETGYSKSCLYINDIGPDDRVLVVEDVLSTGGTLTAILETLASMGATVTGALVMLEKGHAREAVAAQSEVPVLAMKRLTVEAGIVTVEDA